MFTCNRLDLKTLGSWPIMSQNLPAHWSNGHFTHETESPWPLHFKRSHWWERRSRSKFAASHYARGTNRACESKMDVKSTWIPTGPQNGSCFMVTSTMFKNHLLEVRPNTKPRDHGILNAHNCWFTLFHHVCKLTWIKIPLQQHLVEGPVTYGFTIHLGVRDHTTWFRRCLWDNLWTLSFGLSQFHGHGSRLVCEVTQIYSSLFHCPQINEILT